MTTWPENRWFFADGRGYVAYRVHAGVALGLCDPVAARGRPAAAAARSFADRAERRAGAVPVLRHRGGGDATRRPGLAEPAGRRGGRHRPAALAFTGKAWQDVRTALNQAAKQGISWRLARWPSSPAGIQLQVRAISAQWVEDKGLPEMGFTLGGVDEAMDPEVRVGLAVDADGTVHGVTSWMPVSAPAAAQPAAGPST